MTAELLMFLGGITAFGFTVFCVRVRRLRVKYALIWLTLASGLLLIGAFPGILMRLAEWANLSYPAAALFVSLAVIYLFCFAVSVSLSRLHERNLKLTQTVAFLEKRITELEPVSEVSSDEQDNGSIKGAG